jgi:hypothetical protein
VLYRKSLDPFALSACTLATEQVRATGWAGYSTARAAREGQRAPVYINARLLRGYYNNCDIHCGNRYGNVSAQHYLPSD